MGAAASFPSSELTSEEFTALSDEYNKLKEINNSFSEEELFYELKRGKSSKIKMLIDDYPMKNLNGNRDR